jgi:hypothetical protein
VDRPVTRSLPIDREGRAIAVKAEEIQLAVREMTALSNAMVVERLVDAGISRLSAERIVEVERTACEPGRARTHTMSRR